MGKQQHRREHRPPREAGHPANDRKPCDNMPHAVRSGHHLYSRFLTLTARASLRLSITTTIATLLLLPAGAGQAEAQGRVAGRVIDQTGAVLPGVAIDLVVNMTELTTTTDAAGRYQFDSVPTGQAELTYRLLNFSVLRREVAVASGAVVDAEVALALALLEYSLNRRCAIGNRDNIASGVAFASCRDFTIGE